MTRISTEMLHVSTVSIHGRGVMIEGVSGAGKSDLALRLIDRGAVLVSDDYTMLRRDGDRLLASAAPNIAGRIEVRGIGIVDMPYVEDVPVVLLVSLGEPPERLPEADQRRQVAGLPIANIALDGFAASAAIKVELALK